MASLKNRCHSGTAAEIVANFAKFIFYSLCLGALFPPVRRSEIGFTMQFIRVFSCRFAADAANLAKRLNRGLYIAGAAASPGSASDPASRPRNNAGIFGRSRRAALQ